MRVTLELEIDTELFDLVQAAEAEALAISCNGRVYTWKTLGRHNWLEHGFSNVDAAGPVVLPMSLPDRVKMCDDQLDEEEFAGEIGEY